MKIKQGFMLREVAGSHIVVPVGKASEDFNGMVNLNATGAFLWKELTKGSDEDSLVRKLLDAYDADEEQVKKDVASFLSTMKEGGFIE